MKTRQFDAVVFDMDGVIFDSERAVMDCWTTLAEKYNIKDTTEESVKKLETLKLQIEPFMLRRKKKDAEEGATNDENENKKTRRGRKTFEE